MKRMFRFTQIITFCLLSIILCGYNRVDIQDENNTKLEQWPSFNQRRVTSTFLIKNYDNKIEYKEELFDSVQSFLDYYFDLHKIEKDTEIIFFSELLYDNNNNDIIGIKLSDIKSNYHMKSLKMTGNEILLEYKNKDNIKYILTKESLDKVELLKVDNSSIYKYLGHEPLYISCINGDRLYNVYELINNDNRMVGYYCE